MHTPSPYQFDSSNPHEVVTRLQSVAPPFEVRPTKADFGASVRVAPFSNLGLFMVRIRHGNVLVQPMRDMYSINIPLRAGIEWRVGS